MTVELRQRVQRFRAKSSDLNFPDHIIDFENSKFSVSGVKPLHEVMDEMQSAFVWCWSIKDNLKETFFELSDNVNKRKFDQSFEDEVNNFKALTICSDIANKEKHTKRNRPTRSGRQVKLDIDQQKDVSHNTIGLIQRLNGCYYITPKNGEAVKLKANIVDDNGEFVMDAFECIDQSIQAWDIIHSMYVKA